MSISVGVGVSESSIAFQAGKEAARIACKNAREELLDLLFVFASAKFEQQQLLAGIKSVCPQATIAGCSSAGEISTVGATKSSVAIMGLKSDTLRFSTGLGSSLSQDARSAGQQCATQASKGKVHNRQVFIMLPDGLSENGSDIIRGIQEVVGTSFPIVGGSSGDDYLFQKTYQYCNDRVFSDSVVGILLGGDVSVGIGIRHGWHAIGKAYEVTEAHGNTLKKLDGKDAFKIYEEYFGEDAADLKKSPWAKIATIYPLGVSIPDEDELLIRYASKATLGGALVCAADVPEGSQVRLMIADKDGVLDAAQEAALKAKESVKRAQIKAVIVFDSIARKRVLGRAAAKEIEVIRKTMGASVPIIGFYSYGEQAPLRAERYIGKSYFHNETIVVVCIAEYTTEKKL